MRGQRLADDRTDAGHQVEHAGREADVVDDLGEDERVDRRDLRRLEHDGAAGGQRVRDLGADLVERVVPRRDATDDADGLADDGVAVARAPRTRTWMASSDAAENAEMPVPTWMAADWPFGMPTSCVITSAISSRRASSSSATRRSSLPRSGAGSSDHAGNAAFAAATARSMSSGTPAGIVANTSSVVESITSSVSVPAGATHEPSMYKRVYSCMTSEAKRHPRRVPGELAIG